MRRILFGVMTLCFACLSTAQAQEQKDIQGGQDHPLLTRMPGYYLSAFDVKDYDKYDVSAYLTGPDANWEGRITTLGYTRLNGAKPVSMVQISKNYENAIKAIGGKTLASGARSVLAKVQKNGGLSYVQAEAFNDGADYTLVIVETKAMEQEVKADAAALRASLATTGRAIVDGIYFDTAKAVLKPESEPSLAQVKQLLEANPAMALFVVGHTDTVGQLEANLKLSADRADAVVKALVGRGISASRLKSAGVGPYAPVAPNTNDDGRAKNRRVELVAQK